MCDGFEACFNASIQMTSATPTAPATTAASPSSLPTHARPDSGPKRSPHPAGAEVRVEIASSGDIVTARLRGRRLALDLGFNGPDITVIATAISEVARNLTDHAGRGLIVLTELREGGRTGLRIVACDEGPGISEPARVADYGRGEGESGLGLPGVRALMDEFELQSTVGSRTTVIMTKWVT
jgi:serine/threonine-protein kinase RsbT